MMKRIALLCIVALSMRAEPDTVALSDTTIARLVHQVLSRVGTFDDVEHAAFVVMGKEGTPELVYWPSRRRFREAHWEGPLPAGLVAVIHTHPYRRPLPSRQDLYEARRLGIPFYIVSRSSLSVAGPDGRVRRAGAVPWLRRNGMRQVVSLEWYDYSVSFT